MPDVRLVRVFEARDSFGLSLAVSALEAVGIDFLVSGDEPRLPFIDYRVGVGQAPLLKCSSRILVAPEDEREARGLLEPLENLPARGLEEDSEPE